MNGGFTIIFDKGSNIDFFPTFLKEDRSFLRKIHEMASKAQSSIYMIYPWITLGEEMVVSFENALSKHDVTLFLITKLVKEDIFYRRQQLEDIELWRDIFQDKIHIKYNNSIHAKMTIIDEKEVLLGSSNLTGSGMGSSREFEGYPQIEANIYTDDSNAVQKCSDFFSNVWYHEDSIDYIDSEYVLSCKSYNLTGFYRKYPKVFKIIARDEEIKYNNGKIHFKGRLAYLDNKKAYILFKNREDLAVRINDIENLNKDELWHEIDVSGKIVNNGLSEFTVINPTIKDEIEHNSSKNHVKIKDLKENDNVSIEAKINQIQEPKKLGTRFGVRYLTLVEIEDNTGTIILEIWEENSSRFKANSGDKIQAKNCRVKKYNNELSLVPLKDKGKIITH